MRTSEEHAAKFFTCANCKRVRPKTQRAKGRNVCRDRGPCLAAAAQSFSEIRFVTVIP